ncbi:MAG: tryptophan synthase subunit alpha [Actinobacteria bacterium]|nr:MAG: tryptophan synthase subunit alpha [Actinomycetota bacterium]
MAAAFANSGKRAALMPYLMGGFPDIEASKRIGLAYADGGADLVELGVPFSDPLADGPVIHAAGTAALAAGATTGAVLGVCEALAARVAVVVMCYTNLVLAHDDFPARLAAAGASGLIVPDLPLEEAPPLLDACDERARGFLYTVSVTGTTGERDSLSDTFAATVERARSHTDVPVALGFGIATPEHAAQAADAGADGVIVGSRLVRAAAEGEDVRALVEGLAGALR